VHRIRKSVSARIAFAVLTAGVLAGPGILATSSRAAAQPGSPGGPYTTLPDPTPTAIDFGYSVAISGDTAVVGSDNTTFQDSCCIGEAFVYTKQGGEWSAPPVVLQSPSGDLSGNFGLTVAVSGTTVVVGSNDGAYVYTEQNGVWPTTPTAILPDPGNNANDGFGTAVAVWGDTVLVGAQYGPAGARIGAAYLYVNQAGQWPTSPTVTLSDPEGQQGDYFGLAVALSATTAIVTALNSSGISAAYVYDRGLAGWPSAPTRTWADPTDTNGGCFGSSVAVSGSSAIVGDGCTQPIQGLAFIYTQSPLGWAATPSAKLCGTAEDYFGASVAISGDNAVVGAWGEASEAGAAYVYEANGSGKWKGNPTLTVSDPGNTAWDSFGFAVSASNGQVMVGAPGENVGIPPGLGAAYIYDVP